MTLAADNNFLVPNATLLVELVMFGIILGVLWKFVVEPIQRVIADRQALIRAQQEESRALRERLESVGAAHRALLEEARNDAAAIREAARARGQEAIDAARQSASSEADRVIAEGRAALGAQRDALVADLREEIGMVGADLAGRVVGQPLDEAARRGGTVERFVEQVQVVEGRLVLATPGTRVREEA